MRASIGGATLHLGMSSTAVLRGQVVVDARSDEPLTFRVWT